MMSVLLTTLILLAFTCEITLVWLIGIVIAEAMVLGSFFYKKGEESGKRQSEGKLTSAQYIREKELDQRDRDIKIKEINLAESEKKIKRKQTEIFDKEQKCHSVLQEVVSAHPDNQHIARVLNDAEAILIKKEINSILWKAPKTAEKMRQRFNHCVARKGRLLRNDGS